MCELPREHQRPGGRGFGGLSGGALILISSACRRGLVTYHAPDGCHLLLQLTVQLVEGVAFSDRQCYHTSLYAGHSFPDVCAQGYRLGVDHLSCGNCLLSTEFVVRALLQDPELEPRSCFIGSVYGSPKCTPPS